jgi:hypothetical protein
MDGAPLTPRLSADLWVGVMPSPIHGRHVLFVGFVVTMIPLTFLSRVSIMKTLVGLGVEIGVPITEETITFSTVLVFMGPTPAQLSS